MGVTWRARVGSKLTLRCAKNFPLIRWRCLTFKHGPFDGLYSQANVSYWKHNLLALYAPALLFFSSSLQAKQWALLLFKAKGVKGSELCFGPACARGPGQRGDGGAAQRACSGAGSTDKDLIHGTAHYPAGRGCTEGMAGYQSAVQDQILAQWKSGNQPCCILNITHTISQCKLFPLKLEFHNINRVFL